MNQTENCLKKINFHSFSTFKSVFSLPAKRANRSTPAHAVRPLLQSTDVLRLLWRTPLWTRQTGPQVLRMRPQLPQKMRFEDPEQLQRIQATQAFRHPAVAVQLQYAQFERETREFSFIRIYQCLLKY